MRMTISDVSELRALVGTELGTSEWFTITQARVDGFADTTDDHQWIHVDPGRAARESPFGGPIAHGYLTLSLLSAMWAQILTIENLAMNVNYGLNRVRFTAPVPVGGRVRLRAGLASMSDTPAGAQIILTATIECDASDKPVCVAEPIFRYHRLSEAGSGGRGPRAPRPDRRR